MQGRTDSPGAARQLRRLDLALFDVISGKQKARGKSPFELPSRWSAVLAQHPEVAKDLVDPLYPYGAGLIY